jgi:D-sedoheptulose 7-phosphate isomerase
MSNFRQYLSDSLAVLSELDKTLDGATVERAVAAILTSLEANKAFLICGNGGSAADASHIAGELVGRFLKERRALKAIALSADSAIMTAWGNDYSYEDVFARQVHAYGEPGGVLLAISTSGRSKNVVAAVAVAKEKGMTVIGLTGKGGGHLAPMVDILLDVPSTATPLIQQAHMCLYHYLCAQVEARLAPTPTDR